MKILVAVDESPFSQQAVRVVAEQFQPKNAEVQVVNAVEPISAYFSAEYFPHITRDTEEIESERQKQAEALVEKACAKLGQAGFRCSQAVLHGDARAAILDQAKKWKPDLIVVGSHGLKGLNRLLMGSVSEAIVRHAECSVQVVRLRAAERHAQKRPTKRVRKAAKRR
jgi:nucleotide-binding universal stress UspA family protein